MAIDKSIRQHYQDGEKVKSFVPTKTETSYLDNVLNHLISNKIPGLKVQDIRDFKTGKPISKIASKILKERFGIGIKPDGIGFDFKPTDVLKVFNLSQKSGIPFSNLITKALPFGAAAAAIYYLNKNRERLTGYKTQREYDEARDIRILETRRADMLQRKEEGRGYSDKNLEDVTRKIAKKKGLDIKIEKEITGDTYGYPDPTKDIIKGPYIPQFPGEDELILQQRKQEAMFPGEDELILQQRKQEAMFPGEDEIIQQQRKDAEFKDLQAEHKALAEAEAEAQRRRVVTPYVPLPPQLQAPPDSGDRHGDGGGQARGDIGGGSAYSSPFKYGGPVYVYKRNNSVDKALKGRKRDI